MRRARSRVAAGATLSDIGSLKHRIVCTMPAAALHAQLAGGVVLGLLLLHASCAAAAAPRSWSSYTEKPVGTCDAAQQAGRAPNGLWGCGGEAWDRAGPLADFAYAGYGAGEDTIPDPPVAVDVKRDFGAAGSGDVDDSTAVLKALKATEASGGVIFFPPGKYILSEQLTISSNQVLRGAGRDLTTLYFSRSLSMINGWGSKWQAGRENSPYTWAGGLISTQRDKDVFSAESTQPLFNVTQPAKRGDTRLTVTGVKAAQGKRADEVFAPGQWLALRMRENKQADLAQSLTNNKGPVGSNIAPMFGGGIVFTHMSRVMAAGQDWVELERPLHADVELAFQPQLVRMAQAKVVGAGIEDITISFPHTPYLGHHEEAGWNGIEFVSAINSWIRRVRFVNADAAIKLYASIFNTVSDIEIRNTAPRRGGMWYGRSNVYQHADKDGHIGIALHWGSHDNLVEQFNITGLYYHELLVAGYSSHNVFTRGAGTDLCLDHHGAAPHNNLWTDIDLGLGHAAMRWSGDPQHWPFGGSNNVFWSIWASNISVPLDYVGRLASSRVDVAAAKRSAMLYMANRPAREQGFGEVVVDMPLSSEMPAIEEAGDWYVRYDPSTRVWPSNLHTAMQNTKASRLTQAPSPVRIAEATSAAAPTPGIASG